MKLHILGCTAATPGTVTNPTSQILETKGHMFMIDCGEGSQVQLRRNRIKFSRINHIFISHLHGDHVFGLIGLVSTFTLLNRLDDLHIYGPVGIKEMILLQLKLGNSYTGYKLYFHELSSKESELIFEDKHVTVKTIPLKHRVYTNGFLIEEKEEVYQLNLDALNHYEVPVVYYNKAKQGGTITLENGQVLTSEDLTFGKIPQKSYAFCSDTAFHPPIVELIQGASVLYHEATFLKKDQELAKKTLHSTAQEAAEIAKQAQVGQLILGHFSSRYKSFQLFKDEACPIFERTEIAQEGKTFEF